MIAIPTTMTSKSLVSHLGIRVNCWVMAWVLRQPYSLPDRRGLMWAGSQVTVLVSVFIAIPFIIKEGHWDSFTKGQGVFRFSLETRGGPLQNHYGAFWFGRRCPYRRPDDRCRCDDDQHFGLRPIGYASRRLGHS